MKYLRQFGIILGVTCAGEIMKYFIPLPIPGSIYGLILMFLLLLMRVIKVEHVKETGEFLIEIMPLMFIPAGVGLVTSWNQLAVAHPLSPVIIRSPFRLSTMKRAERLNVLFALQSWMQTSLLFSMSFA